jgi:hypothetical protein
MLARALARRPVDTPTVLRSDPPSVGLYRWRAAPSTTSRRT